MTMTPFQFLAPAARIVYGPDSLGQLGRELDRTKSGRALIVCGRSLAHDEPLLGLVTAALGDRLGGIWSGVRAHSPVPSVLACADELKRVGADAVVAVGGGSAIVTARAASILAAEGRPVHELCTRPDGRGGLRSPKLLAPKLPHFVVPTTPTTAAVKAGSAVFDPGDGRRLALFDPKTRATAVFLHPRMLGSAPIGLVTSSSVNTFATAMEGLMSRSGNPLSDALLMHAVRLLGEHLSAPSRMGEESVRGEVALAAVLCGQGTDHTGAGITTVLGHAIGARHEIDNGVANAIVLPHVLRFNAGYGTAGLAKVASALGLPSGDPDSGLSALIGKAQVIFGALGLPTRLRDVNISEDGLPAIADLAVADWFLRGNPRPVGDPGELLGILEQAW